MLTEREKVKLYKAGKYSFKVPGGCTAFWTMWDWIRYIDCSGRWEK